MPISSAERRENKYQLKQAEEAFAIKGFTTRPIRKTHLLRLMIPLK